MQDIITIGSATIDAFVNTSSDEIVKIKHHKTESILTCYPLGSKILVKELKFMTGGGGTNTAVSFSRLGLKTSYLGNIGNDSNADSILKELKKEKISFVGTRSNNQTNYSVILDSVMQDRTILTYRDASRKLDYNRLNKNVLKAKCFYFSSMLDKSFDTSLKLMSYAKKNNIKIAFNPSCYEVDSGRKKIKPGLLNTDILIFNRQEAALLLKKQRSTQIEDLLSGVRKLGPKIVVITDGSRGAWCSNGIIIFSIKPRRIKVVETTGAGDAFASGFVAGIIKGKDIEFAMKLGLVQSESIIQHFGAKNKLLSWNTALKEMKKSPKVVKKTIK